MKAKLLQNSLDTCLVCGLPVKIEAGGVTHEYQDDVYTFCSGICFKRFEENPESFMNGSKEEEE